MSGNLGGGRPRPIVMRATKIRLAPIVAVLALVAVACGESAPSNTNSTTSVPTTTSVSTTTTAPATTVTTLPIPDPIKLAGTRWVATTMFIGGAEVQFVNNARPTIDFNNDGRSFGGSTGCNSYFGEYTIGGGTISFGDMGMTEIACDEPLMTQESHVMAVLVEASIYSVEDGILTIGEIGGSALQYEDRAIAFPDAELAGTQWIGDTIIRGDAATTLVPGSEVTLFIDAAQSVATGAASCNLFTANVEWDATQITFAPYGLTERFCVADGVMEQEDVVVAILQGEMRVEIDGDRLTLSASNGDGIGFRAES